ncbi:MAG: DUF1080 domain-containing protein, partial [Armatimonadota bacterium]|nr:DUF1080 domain-containing protein [Armatimonadota bacterium]
MKQNRCQTRREFLREVTLLTATAALGTTALTAPAAVPDGFRPLFDGKTLNGWTPKPRAQAAGQGKAGKGGKAGQPGSKDSYYERALKSCGRWIVQDGIIIGGQEPPGSGFGGYLVSDEAFGDFELLIDARPDWRVDTGVLVRTVPAGNVGFQVLIDHRPHGGIGGFYGNGLWSFHAWAYSFTAETDKDGRVVR